MGVMSPVGVATATEISMVGWIDTWDVFGSYVALTSGTSRRAKADERMIKSLTDTLIPKSSFRDFRRAMSSSSSISMAV
eukprot:scaffold11675_cov40-Attheya_sp.AAC.3